MRTIYFCLLFVFSFMGQAYAEVNINTASKSELTALTGVGPATADKIIAFREMNGPFASCADLIKVKGIGAKKLESIKPDCVVGETAPGKKSDTPKVNAPTKTTTGTGIDINSASATELEVLNGVGPSTAKKIVEFREKNGPFKTCDGLMKVKGIGPKKMNQLKPQCKIMIQIQK